MLAKNIPKNAVIFECNMCDFKCSKHSNYKHHLNTAKHQKRKNALQNASKNAEIKPQFICGCGKIYKHRQSLTSHKVKCNETTQPNITVIQDNVENLVKSKDKESLIFALLAQNNELMAMLQEQTKVIQDITPRIGSSTTNNITNNHNANTTNNNKFNLQVFLNEDCKDAINFSEFIESIQVTVEDLENQAQLGYVGGISKIFLENMKELGVNKRPLHCTDKKRNTLYIKENNEWDKEGSREQLLYGIKVLTGRANQTLCDMKEDNPVEYSDIDSSFSTKCEDIHRNLLPVFPREATFGKVIDSISNGSIVEKEP
jgi:hypothetical protein